MIYADKALYRIESIEIALKYTKMTKSKEHQKRTKNLTSRWYQNINTFSHMLLDHCYAFGLSL